MMMANVLQVLHVFVIFAVLLDSSSWMNPWDEGSTISGTQSVYKGDDVSIYLAGGRIFEREGVIHRERWDIRRDRIMIKYVAVVCVR